MVLGVLSEFMRPTEFIIGWLLLMGKLPQTIYLFTLKIYW